MKSTLQPLNRRRFIRASAALGPLVGLLWAGLPAGAQISPEEHASHHPEEKPAAPTANSPAGMGAKPDAMSGMGGAGGMGEMMKGMMGGQPPKEFYPSLMALPAATREQRLQLQQQAEARTKIGAALLQQATARMVNPEANGLELQDAAAEARAGLKELESGQAARRALAEGRAPRDVALQWFQREMNLASPMRPEEHAPSVTLFHLFTMVLLIAFALAMVAMYFYKMRRAAALFGRIEAGSGPPPPGSSPPLAGAPSPSSPAAPPDGKAANAG